MSPPALILSLRLFSIGSASSAFNVGYYGPEVGGFFTPVTVAAAVAVVFVFLSVGRAVWGRTTSFFSSCAVGFVLVTTAVAGLVPITGFLESAGCVDTTEVTPPALILRARD